MKSPQIKLLRSSDVNFFLEHLERHMGESKPASPFHPQPQGKRYNTGKNRDTLVAHWTMSLEEPRWERVWGAWDQGRIIAHVDLTGGPLTTMLHRCTLTIGVEKSFKKMGLGEELMKVALKNARSMGIAWVDLRVFRQNRPALSLYKKFGFKKIGMIRDAIRVHGKKIDDVSMTLAL